MQAAKSRGDDNIRTSRTYIEKDAGRAQSQQANR